MKKERFEAFTDAVIAIILTILVLEIHLPNNDHTIRAFIKIAPQFFSYVLTFIFISTMWINHHFIFLEVKRIDNRILWINILLLFWASLLPATTAWMGSDINSVISSSLYVINVILFNITTAQLRDFTISLNPEISNKVSHLRYSERISLFINIGTLFITFFYPPFPFIGLSLNIFLWALPRNH
ncbi:TMEM175 family protein [Companilactobacillus sp. DQM5]|uniref:TMEM175 family protein n=1 Tax=Companilactobacillus sp. DQM5 TaxID=3463359 RepID=UPI00405A3C6A